MIPVRLKFPLSKIVTFDDDIIYERWRLKDLYEKSIKIPSAIIGFRGKRLKRDNNKKIRIIKIMNKEEIILSFRLSFSITTKPSFSIYVILQRLQIPL